MLTLLYTTFFFFFGISQEEETPAAPYEFGGSFEAPPSGDGRVGTRSQTLVVGEFNPLKPLPASALAPEKELPYPFGL